MTFKIYSMSEIRGIPIGSLREFAKEIGVKGPTTMPKEALENAVYVRLKEIEESRKAPSELMHGKSRAEILDKSLVTENDREKFDPYSPKRTTAGLETVTGRFRPYVSGDGIISARLLPTSEDVFVNSGFVESAQLKYGDKVEGRFAVSEESSLKILAEIVRVNDRDVSEPRRPDLNSVERFIPDEPLGLWSVHNDLRALALAAPFKKGWRVLVTHDFTVSTEDFSLRLAAELKERGYEVITLCLGVAPEKESIMAEAGADSCLFDVEEKFVRAAVELASQSACRIAEEGGDAAVVIDGIENCDDNLLIRKLFANACKTDKGSVTVFVTANTDIMEKRDIGLLRAAADACPVLVGRNLDITVDYAASVLKSDLHDCQVLNRLRSMSAEAASAIVANCASRDDAERLLK